MRFQATAHLAAATTAAISTTVHAQPFSITWSSISSGSPTPIASATYAVAPSIGQSIAGAPLSGATYSVTSGFAAGVGAAGGGPPVCYPNCDGSTVVPILNVNDFTCFINAYAAQSSYANCDQSTNPPTLNVNDFFCFLNSYAIGCP